MTEVKRKKVNTNNGWGFGGWYGNIITYDNGIIQKKGVFCYRHTGTTSRNDWLAPVENDFNVLIRNKKGKAITKEPKSDIYIYTYNDMYVATEGEHDNPGELMYDHENVKLDLFKIIKV